MSRLLGSVKLDDAPDPGRQLVKTPATHGAPRLYPGTGPVGLDPGMWFGVLGALEVRGDSGRPIEVGGSVRRTLLAALLCRAGRPVAADDLIDDLWSAPPRSASKTLQSHMVRLRDDLGRATDTAGQGRTAREGGIATSVIMTSRTGYGIDLRASEVDADAFNTSLQEGLQALARQDATTAIARIDEALGWWRGPAYQEFGDSPFAVAERIRLTELRALAQESRTDAALILGQAAVLVGELEQRVAVEPYRERSWEQLIIALYRAGRQADALSTYRAARDRLAADLGVDPGPGLRLLHQRLLDHDLALLAAAGPGPRVSLSAVPVSLDTCPWRGLDGYREADAGLFFGREAVCAQLVARLAEPGAVLVTGASGSGKSSLIRAALVPALRVGAVPGSDAWTYGLSTPVIGWPDAPSTVMVVDQAEEVFSVLGDVDRAAFVDALAAYEEAGGRLVLVLRGDFFGKLADEPWLARLGQRSPILVGPVREDGLRRVVLEPARRVGLGVDVEVVDAVIDDAAGQFQPLPMISVALVRAWEARTGATITLADYRAGGAVAGAIESTAEQVYLELDESERIEAHRLLVRMATRESGAWVRRPLSRPGQADGEAAVADRLILGRLVTATGERLELSHDALLERWPRLVGWLEERASAADELDHLAAAARAWLATGRPVSDLYRGPRLHRALDWRRDHPADVGQTESAFLDASSLADDGDLAQARRRIVVERRARRRLRWVAVGLAAALVLALGVALIAVSARSAAARSADRARSAALSADAHRLAAESLSAPDIATSALLAAASYRLQDTPDTRGAMLSALERGQSALFRVATPRRLVGLVASTDGTRLYALQNNRTVDVIGSSRRAIVTTYPARGATLIGVTGRSLVVAGAVNGAARPQPGRLAVLNAATGGPITQLTATAMEGPATPSIAPGGRWLVADRATDATAQHPTRVLTVYDASDWERPARTVTLPAPVVDIAAGLRTAVVVTSDQRIFVIDLATLRIAGSAHRSDLPTAAASNDESAFTISPDGSRVAFVGPGPDDPPVVLRTVVLQGASIVLPRSLNDALSLAFNSTGSALAVGSAGGALNVYHVTDGQPIASLAGQSGTILGAAWASNGALYTDGLDSQVVSWDVSSIPRLLHLKGATVPSADFAVQSGRIVVGVNPQQGFGPPAQEKMFSFDLTDGAIHSWPLGLTGQDYVTQVTATPDGSRAIVSIESAHANRWQVWDLRRGVVLHTIPALPGDDNTLGLSAAISPDGTSAVIGVTASRLAVVDLPSGRFVRMITARFAGADGSRIHAVVWQFTPDGHVLLWGYDPGGSGGSGGSTVVEQRLGLLDVTRGTVVAQASVGDIDGPKFFAWSHSGTTLAMGTYAGSLATFNAATLRPLREADAVDTGYVLSVGFSPDDRTLVAAGTDSTMTFWDVATLSREGGREAAPNAAMVWWYAWFDPQGDVTGLAPQLTQPGVNRERRFTFPARTTQWLTLTCALAGQRMTRAQWARYAGDEPFRRVC